MRLLILSAIALGSVAYTTPRVDAQSWLPQSGNSSWSLGTNWSTGVPPDGPTASATLAAIITANQTITLDGPGGPTTPVTLNQLVFGSPRFGYTIVPGSSSGLTLSGSGAAITVLSGGGGASAAAAAINTNVTLANNASFVNNFAASPGNPTANLSFGSAVIAIGGFTLGVDGGGVTTFDSQVDGTGAIIKNGAGTLFVNNVSNTFSGTLTINAGMVQFNNGAGSLPAGNGSITVRKGGILGSGAGFANGSGGFGLDSSFLAKINSSSAGVVSVASGTSDPLDFSTAGPISLGSTATASSGSVSGTITPYQDTYRFGGGAQSNLLTLTTGLADGVASRSLVIDRNGTSPSTINLNAVATYTGTTTVNAGLLKANFGETNVSLRPTATADLLPAASLLVLGGGAFQLNGLAATANSQTVNGLTVAAGGSAVWATSGNSGGSAVVNLGGSSGTATISRSLGGTVQVILPNNGSISLGTGTGSGTQNALLTDSGGVAYATVGPTTGATDWAAKSGTNTVVAGSSIGGFYTPSTATTLAGNADVTAGVNTSLASSATITSLRFDNAQSITLAGGVTLTTGGILATPNVFASATITGGSLRGPAGRDLVVFNYSSSSVVLGSAIQDNGSATGLTVTAATGAFPTLTPTTVTLTGANTYTGPTVVTSGNLQVGSGGTAGALPTNGSVVLRGNQSSLVFNRSDNTTFGGSISGDGNPSALVTATQWAVNKRGDGTVTLTAPSTYTGSTAVSRGTLRLDFSGLTTPTNLLYNGSDAVYTGPRNLVFNGGTLELVAKPGAASSQTFDALVLANGASGVVRPVNAGGGTMTVRIGEGWTRSPRSVLGIDLTGGGTVASAPGRTNGLIGYATVTDTANGTNFATVAAGSVVGFTAYATLTDAANDPGTTYVENGATGLTLTAGAKSYNALKLAPSAPGQTLNLNGNTLSLTSRSILFTGSNSYTVTGGQLGATGSEVIVFNYATAPLTVSATLPANASSQQTTSFSVAGTGTTVLLNATTPTYTGGTTVHTGATLQLGDGTTSNGLLPSTGVVVNGTLAFNLLPGAPSRSNLSGAGRIVQNGPGTLVLPAFSNNSHTGGTVANALIQLGQLGSLTGGGPVIMNPGGTVQFTGSSPIFGSSDLIFAGGTLSTGESTGNGNSDTGRLVLNVSSTISLGTGNHTVIFTSIQNNSLSGTVLSINGWAGSPGSSGTGGKLVFTGLGDTPNTTYADFLNTVQFSGYNLGQATFIPSGANYELVVAVVPEPATVLGLGAAGLGLAGWVRRRRGSAGSQS